MNEYSQITSVDMDSPSEHSGCVTKVAGCSMEDFSVATVEHRRRNPFRISYLDRLRYPVCSPSLLKSIENIVVAPSGDIDILTSCDIDENDIFLDETLDSETEKAAQETISLFFEDVSKNIFVTPDKTTNSFLIAPGEVNEDEDISLSYTCDPSTLQYDIHLSTTWAQTNITFPPNLPEQVESVLKQFENEPKVAEYSVCDAVCEKHSQDIQTDVRGRNYENVKKVTGYSQTILSFPITLPESLETLLSSYETFFEEIYTDVRMSMLKRQLYSEHYVSSPQFHCNSPLSTLNDTSPLQSGSAFTPQCTTVRLRHYGSPMGDILSPTGISPIVKPSNTNRFLSKFDFLYTSVETPDSTSPSFLQMKDTIFPSSDGVSHQRN